MKAKKIQVTITGVRPLIMHNIALADPLSPQAKAVSRAVAKYKNSKDAEKKAEAVGRAEFEGGLYFDEQLGPVVPTENLEKMLRDGAADERRGKDTQSDVEIVSCDGADVVQLQYDGPRTVSGLYKDKRFVFRKMVRIAKARVARTRPRFSNWSLTFDVLMYPWSSLDADTVKRALETAGTRKGLLEWRPRYGLFEVTKFG